MVLKSKSPLVRKGYSYESVVPKNYATLPISILKRIFTYIHRRELLKSTSLVCKQWRYAAMQPEFLHSFSVSGDSIPLPYIYNHLRKSLKLHSLHLENIANPFIILLQASKCVISLKSLSMKNCTRLPSNILSYIVTVFPNLQKLNLERSYVSGEAPAYSKLLKLSELRSLNLTKIDNLTMQHLLEIVLNCRKLEELDISLLPPAMDLEDENACLIINNIRKMLKSLSIDCRSLTNRTFQKIFSCKRIERLIINYGANFTADLLVDFWKYFPKIKELGFRHNFHLNGNDFCNLFEYGANIYKNLILLDFTYCVLLNDEAIEAIAKCCKNLQKIYLKSCRSLTTVVPLCIGCKELRLLDISFCIGIYEIFDIPQKLETLIIHQWFYILLQEKRCVGNNIRLNMYLSLSEFTDELEMCYINSRVLK